jgi:hypothetical protein
MTTGHEPQLGGLSPQLGGSNYYLIVNFHRGGDELDLLAPSYATEAQAKLALIDWLHENFPEQWTLSSNGRQFIFTGYSGRVMAGEVVSKEWVDGMRQWELENRDDPDMTILRRDSKELNHAREFAIE